MDERVSPRWLIIPLFPPWRNRAVSWRQPRVHRVPLAHRSFALFEALKSRFYLSFFLKFSLIRACLTRVR